MSGGCVNEEHRTDKNWDLDKTCKACEQSGDDEGSAKNVRENNVMCQYGTCEPRRNTCGSVLQFVHVRDKLQALIGDEDTQRNSEEVEESGPMMVAP